MSSPELSTVQHVILCSLAWRGPQTPYQLKDYIERVVGFYWTFPHAQIYTEPPKLAALGLVDEEREEGGRRRKTYSITESGLDAVREWLAAPTTRPPEIRDLGLLKLHFSGLSTTDSVVALAEQQVEFHEARLAELRDAMAGSDIEPEHRRFVRTGGRLGLGIEELIVAQWRDVLADPDRRKEAARRGKRSIEPFRA
jgi:PadR family transcriptional regulator, regulatory protein AphA